MQRLAFRSGVTTAVASPIAGSSLFSGLSFAFSTAADHPLSRGAILNPAAALHLNMESSKLSTSSKIAILRRLLSGESGEEDEITEAMQKVASGDLRIVVQVTKADTMGALVRLKREVASEMKMTFIGAHEAWMVSLARLLKTLDARWTNADGSSPTSLRPRTSA